MVSAQTPPRTSSSSRLLRRLDAEARTCRRRPHWARPAGTHYSEWPRGAGNSGRARGQRGPRPRAPCQVRARLVRRARGRATPARSRAHRAEGGPVEHLVAGQARPPRCAAHAGLPDDRAQLRVVLERPPARGLRRAAHFDGSPRDLPVLPGLGLAAPAARQLRATERTGGHATPIRRRSRATPMRCLRLPSSARGSSHSSTTSPGAAARPAGSPA